MNANVALLAMVALNCAGTVALRQAASEGLSATLVAAWAAAGCGCWIIGAGLYLHLLTSTPLGALATASSIGSIVVMIAIGHLAYGETYSSLQVLGLVLGLVAVGLILGAPKA